MEYLRPRNWREALDFRGAHPGAVAVAGATDLMPQMNLAGYRPPALLDLGGLPELTGWQDRSAWLWLGAAMTYTEVIAQLEEYLPALAGAARTVGSPQIRNRGTIGGNLATASPAGDCHPVLLANRATVVAESFRGERLIPAREFYLGPKHSALAEDELIRGLLVPKATAPQQFMKLGARNAMVISATSFALALHRDEHRVGTGIGSAGPTPLVAMAAERYLQQELTEGEHWDRGRPLPKAIEGRFAELVADSAKPVDDHRATAYYRRHCLRVLARRALRWCWTDYLKGF